MHMPRGVHVRAYCIERSTERAEFAGWVRHGGGDGGATRAWVLDTTSPFFCGEFDVEGTQWDTYVAVAWKRLPNYVDDLPCPAWVLTAPSVPGWLEVV